MRSTQKNDRRRARAANDGHLAKTLAIYRYVRTRTGSSGGGGVVSSRYMYM